MTPLAPAGNRAARLSDMFEREATLYRRKYAKYFNVLESKSPLSRVRKVNVFDIYALGKQFEQWSLYQRFCEEDGSVSQLGKLPLVAFDVLTVVYGSSPLSVIAMTQPIGEEEGTVYYKDLIAQTTRGGVTAGHRLLSPDQEQQDVMSGFTSDFQTKHADDTVDNTTTYSLTLDGTPVRPFKTKIRIPALTLEAVDINGDGKLVGYNIQADISYATGAITNLKIPDPNGAFPIYVDYSADFEAFTTIPKMIMKFRSRKVSARVWTLEDTMGLAQAFVLRTRFSMVAEDQLATDLVSAITMEMMTAAVQLIVANIPSGSSTTFDTTAPTGVSYFEHKQSWKDSLAQAESKMLSYAGRGTINALIAGRNQCAIIQTLPGFEKVVEGAPPGPHIYGKIDGITVVRVPNSNILDADTTIGLYRGNTPFEGSLVYAPFMPLVMTPTLPHGTNPLLSRRAAAVWAGLEMIVPNFATKIVGTDV